MEQIKTGDELKNIADAFEVVFEGLAEVNPFFAIAGKGLSALFEFEDSKEAELKFEVNM